MAASTDVPNRLSPGVQKQLALAALIACLLVGGGIVYFLMFATAPRLQTVRVDPKLQSAGVDGRLPLDRSARDWPGVHHINETRWQVTAKSATMMVFKEKSGYRFNFNFARGFVPPEEVTLLAALVRAQTDEAMARQWGVSPEQGAALKKLRLRGGLLDPPKEDRAALSGLWDGYLKAGSGAARAAAQKALVEKLEGVAQAHSEAARKTFRERMESARKVLTADQLQKLSQRT